MYTAAQKIHKDKGAEPSEFEENVAQVVNWWMLWSLLHYVGTIIDYTSYG